MLPSVCLIIPVLNEERLLPSFFQHLHSVNGAAQVKEFLITDGGSVDKSAALAKRLCPQAVLLHCPGGRDRQLNHALEAASADIIVCCPVDVRLWPDAIKSIQGAVAGGCRYGCLHQRSASRSYAFQIQDLIARLRTRWCASAYMDQVPFWQRSWALAAGGFRPCGSYDTADLCWRIGRPDRFRMLTSPVVSSCRAWRFGFFRQVLANQRRRLAYLRRRRHL